MARLFARLSGEHPTLPKAEVKAILEAESMLFNLIEAGPCYLRFNSQIEALEALERRAAYCQACGIEIFTCEASEEAILKAVKGIPFENYIASGESFAVRVRRVCGSPKLPNIPGLEREIGAAIWRRVKGLKVNLSNPDKLFLGLILPDGRFLFGLSKLLSSKSFTERKPTRKPFSHPSTLQPKLARCMVNLSRARRGGLLFDPFCGTGSILLEAGIMGIEAVGGDLQPKMTLGAKVNLAHYGIRGAHLLVADAVRPPLSRVDFIVTDPPYGRSASTIGRPLLTLLEDFLSSAGEILTEDGWLCMASPDGIGVPELAEGLGFKLVESHAIHVHKSLTRLVLVFKP